MQKLRERKQRIFPGVSRGPKLGPANSAERRECRRKPLSWKHSRIQRSQAWIPGTEQAPRPPWESTRGRGVSDSWSQHLSSQWKPMRSPGWPQRWVQRTFWAANASGLWAPPVLWETTCLHGGLRRGGGGYQGSGLYRHLPPRKAGALRPVALGIKSTWRPGPGPMAFWIGAPPFSGHLLRLLLLHNVTPIYLDWVFASLPPSSQMLPFKDCVFL